MPGFGWWEGCWRNRSPPPCVWEAYTEAGEPCWSVNTWAESRSAVGAVPRAVWWAPGLWERHLWRALNSMKERFLLAMDHTGVIREDKLIGKRERPWRLNVGMTGNLARGQHCINPAVVSHWREAKLAIPKCLTGAWKEQETHVSLSCLKGFRSRAYSRRKEHHQRDI